MQGYLATLQRCPRNPRRKRSIHHDSTTVIHSPFIYIGPCIVMLEDPLSSLGLLTMAPKTCSSRAVRLARRLATRGYKSQKRRVGTVKTASWTCCAKSRNELYKAASSGSSSETSAWIKLPRTKKRKKAMLRFSRIWRRFARYI